MLSDLLYAALDGWWLLLVLPFLVYGGMRVIDVLVDALTAALERWHNRVIDQLKRQCPRCAQLLDLLVQSGR